MRRCVCALSTTEEVPLLLLVTKRGIGTVQTDAEQEVERYETISTSWSRSTYHGTFLSYNSNNRELVGTWVAGKALRHSDTEIITGSPSTEVNKKRNWHAKHRVAGIRLLGQLAESAENGETAEQRVMLNLLAIRPTGVIRNRREQPQNGQLEAHKRRRGLNAVAGRTSSLYLA